VIAGLDRVPFIAPAGIKNAAGDTPEPTVAPGSLIMIVGESLAPRSEVGPQNPLAQTIADVVVTVNDRILPLVSVSPQQINAQILSDLPDGEYTLRVRWTGKPDVTANFRISRNSPGLFARPAAEAQPDIPVSMALHEDGTPITTASPARIGETVTIFGTGFGPYRQQYIDGFAFPDPSNFETADSVEISAGETVLQPEWSGGAPGRVGTTATRFKISPEVPRNSAPLRVRINGKLSNAVVLPVE
jgi:uncharacterized protein (TIGR03437 family)